MARVDAARTRRSFSRLENTTEVPNLIDIQRRSFEWLVDTEKGGLRETIDDVSPIEDYTGNLAVVFEEIHFDDPVAPISECREKDLTYARPLTVKVAFQNRETGEIREQSVFMGDFPWMTDWGTFIINGTERVVVTQLVRSPGAYVMEPKDREKQVFIANLMPARGSWLELEIDKKGRVYVRIDRKRKLPVSVLLRAMGDTLREGKYVPEGWTGTDEEILEPLRQLALHAPHARGRHRGHEVGGRLPHRAVQEAAPGRAAVDRRREEPAEPALLRPQALRPHARGPLQAEQPPAPRREARHPHAHPARHHRADQGAHHAPARARHPRVRHVRGRTRRRRAHQGLRARGHLDAARADRRAPRRVRALRQPPSAHGRRADPGGLPHRPLPDGARGPRAPHHRGLGHDHAADDHQHPPGRGRAEGVLRLLAAQPVHGPDELAVRAQAPAPPVGARRRRSHARARAHRGARRAPDALRAHVPDRDAGGPEHRPDRLAVELRRGLRARLRDHALPRGRGRRRDRQGRPPGCEPGGGHGHRAGQLGDGREDRQAQGHDRVPHAGRRAGARHAQGRGPDGRVAEPDLVGDHGADPVPRARRRQPRPDGLEHAGPGGAAPEDGGAADRHRHGDPCRDRHRRRGARRTTPAP